MMVVSFGRYALAKWWPLTPLHPSFHASGPLETPSTTRTIASSSDMRVEIPTKLLDEDPECLVTSVNQR